MNFDILRQKILEKAIRGELVPQLESEPEVIQICKAPKDVPFFIPLTVTGRSRRTQTDS